MVINRSSRMARYRSCRHTDRTLADRRAARMGVTQKVISIIMVLIALYSFQYVSDDNGLEYTIVHWIVPACAFWLIAKIVKRKR